MQFQENISLKPYNSFAIEAKARYFASFQSPEMLLDILGHLPVKKRQKQSSNVRAVHVSIGHQTNFVITKFFNIEIVFDRGGEFLVGRRAQVGFGKGGAEAQLGRGSCRHAAGPERGQ